MLDVLFHFLFKRISSNNLIQYDEHNRHHDHPFDNHQTRKGNHHYQVEGNKELQVASLARDCSFPPLKLRTLT